MHDFLMKCYLFNMNKMLSDLTKSMRESKFILRKILHYYSKRIVLSINDEVD